MDDNGSRSIEGSIMNPTRQISEVRGISAEGVSVDVDSVHECINVDGDEEINIQTENVPAPQGTETLNDEDEALTTRKRQKTSKVWDEFIEVTLSNGKKKAECIHCKAKFAMAGSGTTSTYKRHLQCCLKRRQHQRPQQLLNFQPTSCDDSDYDKSHPLVGSDTKYDTNKTREAIANWLLGTEQPFSVVEDELFVRMMKTATPMFEKVSRVTIKTDCFKVYEHEKKKLKALIHNASKISLTTDCWKSSHQRIEYMVITGHFIDQNWRFGT